MPGKKKPPEEEPLDYVEGRDSEAQYCAFRLGLPWSLHPAAWMWVQCGGQPGDGIYFGFYSMLSKKPSALKAALFDKM